MLRCLPGMSLLAKLSRMASTRSWPFGMLVPRTCWDRTSLGLCASGFSLIFSARSLTCSVASSMARKAAPSVCGRGICGDSAAGLSAVRLVSVIMILRAGSRQVGRCDQQSRASNRHCHNLALFPGTGAYAPLPRTGPGLESCYPELNHRGAWRPAG